MDTFSSQFYDPHTSSSHSPTRASSSDSDEFSLAASCPKKQAGRTTLRETRHPVFRGVRRRNGDKWVCEVREPMKKTRIWLGTYPTPEMAARAHDVAALALRGKSACLNFADSGWRLPVPVSAEAGDIRRAANEAAEMFRPRNGACDDVEGMGMGMDVLSGDDEGKVVYVDEEEVFHMPRVLADMAEGLLMSPPEYVSVEWEPTEITDFDISLWSFS